MTKDISIVSAELPTVSSSRKLHRHMGFWRETIERCRSLELNHALKIRLLPSEVPKNFAAAARSVAKQKGFYLNTGYKYPFMYLWPDRMRGQVKPEDYDSTGALIFENEESL